MCEGSAMRCDILQRCDYIKSVLQQMPEPSTDRYSTLFYMMSYQKDFLNAVSSCYPVDLKLKHLAFCHHLANEVHELCDSFPWKLHRTDGEPNREKMLDEAADVLKLLFNVLLLHGIQSTELVHAFWKKSLIVEQRELAKHAEA